MRRKILKLLVSNCNNFHYYCFFLVSNLMNQHVAHVFLYIPQICTHTQMCPANGREHRTHPHTERAIVCVLGFFVASNGCRRYEYEGKNTVSNLLTIWLMKSSRRSVDSYRVQQRWKRFTAHFASCRSISHVWRFLAAQHLVDVAVVIIIS